jgi:hypothetical protein
VKEKSTKSGSVTRHDDGRDRRLSVPEMTDAEIDAAIASDPERAEMGPIDWTKAEVVIPPKKRPISIRLDQGPHRLLQEARPRLSAAHQRRPALLYERAPARLTPLHFF